MLSLQMINLIYTLQLFCAMEKLTPFPRSRSGSPVRAQSNVGVNHSEVTTSTNRQSTPSTMVPFPGRNVNVDRTNLPHQHVLTDPIYLSFHPHLKWHTIQMDQKNQEHLWCPWPRWPRKWRPLQWPWAPGHGRGSRCNGRAFTSRLDDDGTKSWI